jgi:hypothetical protein
MNNKKHLIMKKTFVSLLAAFAATVASSAHAASVTATPTNVIDVITAQLKITSVTATNTTYATNIVIHITDKVHTTNTTVTTNISYVSTTSAITSSTLINALTTNTAPAASFLVRVRETNGSSYLAVRHAGVNVLVITNGQFTFSNTRAVPLSPFKEKITPTSTSIIGTADELMDFSFNTPTLTISGGGIGTRTWNGDSFAIGNIELPDVTESVTVGGTGTDSLGSDEIVTGTITVGGDTLGN